MWKGAVCKRAASFFCLDVSQGFPWDFFLACCLQIIYNNFYKRFHAGENNE